MLPVAGLDGSQCINIHRFLIGTGGETGLVAAWTGVDSKR